MLEVSTVAHFFSFSGFFVFVFVVGFLFVCVFLRGVV